MKNKLVTSILVLATSISAVNAFADPYDHNGPDRGNPNQPGFNQDHRDNRNNGQFNNDRHDNRGFNQNHKAPRYQQNRVEYRHDMPRPGHEWRKGQKVPTQYRGRGYYVNDWRDRELPAPPSGHRWLNVNGDYVLVAIATGVISSILLGGH